MKKKQENTPMSEPVKYNREIHCGFGDPIWGIEDLGVNNDQENNN